MARAARRGAALLAALLALALAGCEDSGGGGTNDELTYYWDVSPEDADLTTPLVNVLDIHDNVIATAPKDLVKRIAVEGTGFLEDGTLINLACSCAWPDSRFEVVDTNVAPWGYDARGEALVPFQTLAVDPDVIDLGASVYLPAFDGLELPDGTVHDGCFIGGDTGYGIIGKHIDFFAGTYDDYLYLDAALGEATETKVKAPGPCP